MNFRADQISKEKVELKIKNNIRYVFAQRDRESGKEEEIINGDEADSVKQVEIHWCQEDWEEAKTGLPIAECTNVQKHWRVELI